MNRNFTENILLFYWYIFVSLQLFADSFKFTLAENLSLGRNGKRGFVSVAYFPTTLAFKAYGLH